MGVLVLTGVLGGAGGSPPDDDATTPTVDASTVTLDLPRPWVEQAGDPGLMVYRNIGAHLYVKLFSGGEDRGPGNIGRSERLRVSQAASYDPILSAEMPDRLLGGFARGWRIKYHYAEPGSGEPRIVEQWFLGAAYSTTGSIYCSAPRDALAECRDILADGRDALLASTSP